MLPATLALIAVGPGQEGRRDRRGAHRRHPGRQAHRRPDAAVPPAADHPRGGGLRARRGAHRCVRCTAQVETLGRTGVEMEALTAVQVGLLTVYDMCKAADRGMVMGDIRAAGKARRQVGRLGGRRLSARAAALSCRKSRQSRRRLRRLALERRRLRRRRAAVAGLEELVGQRVAELAQALRQVARLVQLAAPAPAPGPRRSSAACPAGSAVPRVNAGSVAATSSSTVTAA